MSVVAAFNGKDLPDGMASLPAGRYVLERVDEGPSLTPEEKSGIREALESLQAGTGLDAAEVRQRIQALLA
jgi:hypothetical protein